MFKLPGNIKSGVYRRFDFNLNGKPMRSFNIVKKPASKPKAPLSFLCLRIHGWLIIKSVSNHGPGLIQMGQEG